jgi:L-ribulokinase
MVKDAFVIGVDFGTDSVRTIIADASNGHEVACSVFNYPRWADQLYCNPDINQFRQHPADYIEGLENSIKHCIKIAGSSIAKNIKGISIDTTGSTPVAVNEQGLPLSLFPAFKENPNAMFVLWKDHTSIKEAEQINSHATSFPTNYLSYVGGIYSSEWFWAKLLHVLRQDEQVRKACYSWVEHCDWIPFLLTGGKHAMDIRRGVCAAGHKSLWSNTWGGLPPDDFFSSLDPLLKGFTSRLFNKVYTSDKSVGTLSTEWTERLGLNTNVVVGIGAFDCHMGAVGGQIEPYFLSKVMGTSTCDMLVAPPEDVGHKLVKGICGQVNDSIIPGMIGMEAGQSAFGDAYAWFKNLVSWPLEHVASSSNLVDKKTLQQLIHESSSRILQELSDKASLIDPEESAELCIDWFNGRRTPDANQLLEGAFSNISLASDAPKLFRSIVEATCFGSKAIVDRFIEERIGIKGLIGLGGVAQKSGFIMQMLADVINMPIRIHRSEQTCALGAAMFAATTAGIYNKVEDAMDSMGQGFQKEYTPDPSRVKIYKKRYEKYRKFGDYLEDQLSTEHAN